MNKQIFLCGLSFKGKYSYVVEGVETQGMIVYRTQVIYNFLYYELESSRIGKTPP